MRRNTRLASLGIRTQAAGPGALARDDVFAGKGFLQRFLSERNLILNVSAVLWRRQAIVSALENCRSEFVAWRIAGDWRLYLELLSAGEGSVAYVAEPLNIHRRHPASVSSQLDRQTHLAEVARMHAHLRIRLAADRALQRRQAKYVRELRQQFKASKKALLF